MKTRNVLLTLGATILAVITINANAALLSPRAVGNQPTQFAGTYNDPILVNTTGIVSPRAAGNEAKTIIATDSQTSRAALCSRHMSGNPKAIEACATSTGPMSCCGGATN
jgi:hypothetical protein